MWECKLLLDIFGYLVYLPYTARFVDRDMFMRFLGYGIGHKNQTKCVEPSDEVDDQDDLEEDKLDLQNMARIAHNQNMQPMSELVDDTRGGDDNPLSENSDAVSEPDDEYSLDGNF